MDVAETDIHRRFAAVRQRPSRATRTGPYDASSSIDEDVIFVDVQDRPKGWHYSDTDGDFYLDTEEGLLASEISEKHLTLVEKEEFVQAKVKELQSFFDNDVWEQADVQASTPNKVMRARFLLKWSKNADGSKRAKARLVIQGFRGPDALAGNLAKASPTTARLSRMMITMVCCI